MILAVAKQRDHEALVSTSQELAAIDRSRKKYDAINKSKKLVEDP